MVEDGGVKLPSVDGICVVIGRTRHGMMVAEIQEAAKQGARFLEIRLDFLKKAPDFRRILENKSCFMMATVRRPHDGGKWDRGEEERLMLLRQAIVAGFDWVDLETDIIDRVPRFGSVRRVCSYHNFREFPADLEKIHERMCRQDADVVKIVVRAQHPNDNLRVLSLIQNSEKPTVAFCSGDVGFASRILQARFGSPFTYAAFNKERNIAPGIPSFHEMQHTYHYRSVDAHSDVFGVIGDPVSHSLSPLIHNAAFRKLGINAVYVPFRVPKEMLSDFLFGFEQIPVKGYSVTIPHKEAAASSRRGRKRSSSGPAPPTPWFARERSSAPSTRTTPVSWRRSAPSCRRSPRWRWNWRGKKCFPLR
ncbi:MAG: type I 3-dehydroquinate dehydratase [Gemmataceae bacterium]